MKKTQIEKIFYFLQKCYFSVSRKIKFHIPYIQHSKISEISKSTWKSFQFSHRTQWKMVLYLSYNQYAYTTIVHMQESYIFARVKNEKHIHRNHILFWQIFRFPTYPKLSKFRYPNF